MKPLDWWVSNGGGWTSAPEESTPDQKQKNRSEDGGDQPGAVLRLIPACLLPQIRRRNGADDAQEAGQHEPEGSLSAGRHKPGDHASDQAERHDPHDAHESPSRETSSRRATRVHGWGCSAECCRPAISRQSKAISLARLVSGTSKAGPLHR